MYYLKLLILMFLVTVNTLVGSIITAFGILIRRDVQIAAFFIGINEKLCKDFGFPADW
jgi:hypothetical protein